MIITMEAPGKITRDIGLRFPTIPGFASNVIKRDVNNTSTNNNNIQQPITTSIINLPNNTSPSQITTIVPTTTTSSYNISGQGNMQPPANISSMTTNLNQITLSSSQSFSQQIGSTYSKNTNIITTTSNTTLSLESKDSSTKCTSPNTTKTLCGNDTNLQKKLSTINPFS